RRGSRPGETPPSFFARSGKCWSCGVSSGDRGKWRVIAWVVTAVMAATVCYSVLRIPLQVTDGLIPMLDAQRTSSVAGAFSNGATAAGYFRPLRAAQIQALFELSYGHYHFAYKGF